MRHVLFGLAVCNLVAFTPSLAFAWNSTGHRVVAYVAYKQLDAATQERVADLLKRHPAAKTDLWTKAVRTNGDCAVLNRFLNAATFPDDARSEGTFGEPGFSFFSRPSDHYVNVTFTPPSVTPGISIGGNILASFEQNLATVRNTNADAPVRATSLSWIFHQVGDVHQPLHSTVRVSEKFPLPKGDLGGNLVHFPNPRGSQDWEFELHAYWDNLLGGDKEVSCAAQLKDVGDSLIKEFSRESFKPSEIQGADNLNLWVMESYSLAVEKVYLPLGDRADGTKDLPDGYEAAALKVGRRRAAQAGYRLAEVLKTLFPESAEKSAK